jgi:hypothetical protein
MLADFTAQAETPPRRPAPSAMRSLSDDDDYSINAANENVKSRGGAGTPRTSPSTLSEDDDSPSPTATAPAGSPIATIARPETETTTAVETTVTPAPWTRSWNVEKARRESTTRGVSHAPAVRRYNLIVAALNVALFLPIPWMTGPFGSVSGWDLVHSDSSWNFGTQSSPRMLFLFSLGVLAVAGLMALSRSKLFVGVEIALAAIFVALIVSWTDQISLLGIYSVDGVWALAVLGLVTIVLCGWILRLEWIEEH